jgi:ABC-type spermidine/putrescine transport system permease subunit II
MMTVLSSLPTLAGRAAHRLLVGVLVAFLLGPALVVVCASFSDSSFITFPPKGWGLHQYHALLASSTWGPATLRSLVIALPVALLAVTLATLAVIALERTRVPLAEALGTALTVPLLLPGVAYAVALYALFVRLRLLDTFQGIILAHTILTLPVALLIMRPAMRVVGRDLELVAMTLGATRARAWLSITARLLAPAIGAALIVAFLTSFDEAVIVSFVSGPDTVTLPKAILDSASTGVDPTITAIAALLIALTGLMLLVAERLRPSGTSR